MSRNNGFKKIMMNQLLEKCRKAGIDPQTVDLAKYDFDSFSSINDLITYYANQGDPICIKILNAEYKFVDDYVNYLESKLQEYNSEAEEEELRGKEDLDLEERMKKLEKALEEMKVDIDKIDKICISLENKIIDRTEWLNGKFEKRYEELAREVEQIKKEKNAIVTKAIEDVKRDVKNEIDRIWEYKVKGLQTYLEDFIKTVVIEKPSSQETREETKALEERLNRLEEDVNKLRRGLEERGLTEKRVEERLKGIEEMITYATRRSVEYTEELRRANDELRERYLDLASKYQGMIALIEKASAQQLNKTKGDALEVKPALPASRGINWKKVAIQVLKGVYLGLICIPLLPFLPILYNNTVVKEAKAMMRKKREKTLMSYLGA